MNDKYVIKVGNCYRELPLVKASNIYYYSFNMIGDVELNKEAAKEISKYLFDIDVIVTIESKAIALTQEIASIMGHSRYVVIRKSKKSYMKNEKSVSGNTIISGTNDYYLDGIDIDYLKNKKICLIDDVISTCGTIDAVYRLLKECNLSIDLIACVLCEGRRIDSYKDIPIKSIGFIPIKERNND